MGLQGDPDIRELLLPPPPTCRSLWERPSVPVSVSLSRLVVHTTAMPSERSNMAAIIKRACFH